MVSTTKWCEDLGDVVKGFGKATYSLFQHCLQGFSSSVSFTVLAKPSGDSDFARKRAIQRSGKKQKL